MKDKKEKYNKQMLPILIAIIILIVIVIIICSIVNKGDEKNIKGYAKLLESSGENYTFIYDNNKIKTYSGYSDMSDFYYDVTCVSKKSEENEYFSEDALITKSEKIIIDYGVYDDITQLSLGKYYKVEKDNKYGIVDYKGKILIPVEYNYIIVSSVQDDKELIFICQKEKTYDYINENGKVIMQSTSENYTGNISYFYKFNEDYDTVISINDGGNTRYFDLKSGEEVLKNEENLNFKYNIQVKDRKVIIYNKDMSVKEEIDAANSYNITTDVYCKKYIVLSERILVDGKRSGKYTVYDENYKKIFTSENEMALVQNEDEDIYFIISGNDYTEIYNKKGSVKRIDEHVYVGGNNEKCKFIVLKRVSEAKYDVYDLKGKLVLEDVSNYRYSGSTLIVTKKDESSSTDYMLIDKNKLIAIDSTDNIISDNYIIVENLSNKTTKVYDTKGNLVIDTVNGIKEFYTEDYICIKNDDVYTVYDINNGKKTFEYSSNDYVSKYNDFEIVKLKDGYYNYNGKKLFDLSK